jgi:hypothetical protein
MRRWIFMAALGVALLVTPLWAQRGGRGGMAGGGGHAGASHVGASGVGVARGSNAYRSYYGSYHYGHYPYYGWRYPWWRYRGGYGYGWYGGVAVGYYPSGWYSDSDTQYPVYVYANPDNSSAAYYQQQEIDRLNNEVAELRAEQQSRAAESYAQPPKAQIQASTVLVFRDNHSEQIQNYAIVGKTLWVFTEQRARKIPIAELNVPATTKANEARGIDFRLPGQ